ncbi:MAG TPA: hypothetical protein DGH68_07585 [Bacteroidetes bacterium]|nr:hypothetical protein [Bacteroidota bacterium]
MKGEFTMKQLLVLLTLLLVLGGSDAFGWGNATHMYYANQLGVAHGGANQHEMYGAVLVDAFNLMLDPNGMFLADQTHHNYAPMLCAAWRCDLKAVAFGFTSHNDTWGEDFTAHHVARTIPAGGYAVVKGAELAPALIPQIVAILNAAGVPEPNASAIAAALAPEFGHDLVETAVDLWIKRNQDPAIGGKIALAATTRPLDTPLLLAAAYARPLSQYAHISLLDATRLIIAAEREYRQQMIQYGGALMLSEPQTIEALAGASAAMAETYLEMYAGVPVAVDPAVVVGFLTSAMTLVGPTYAAEVSATLNYVRHELQQRGIRSCGSFFGKEGAAAEETPTEFSLGENYPNPFNPATTITFSIPSQASVSLEIFNILGQKVKTLADNKVYEGGVQSEMWDGKNAQGTVVPSGTYFSRLTTPGGVFMRKMMLMK